MYPGFAYDGTCKLTRRQCESRAHSDGVDRRCGTATDRTPERLKSQSHHLLFKTDLTPAGDGSPGQLECHGRACIKHRFKGCCINKCCNSVTCVTHNHHDSHGSATPVSKIWTRKTWDSSPLPSTSIGRLRPPLE